MKKKFTAVILLVIFAAAAALTGCSKDENDRIVVATIDGKKVTKSEYLESWQNAIDNSTTIQNMLNDPTQAEEIEDLRKRVLESVVSQKVTDLELKKLGYYKLNAKDRNTFNTYVDDFLQSALAYKQNEMMAELGENYTEKEYDAATKKYTELVLEESGIELKDIEEYYAYVMAMEKAEADLIDLTVSDEEAEELFNQRVQEDKEYFSADLAAYEYLSSQGTYQLYYTPEGIRNVRHVLIALDDETIAEIRNLRSSGDDKAADTLAETAREAIYDDAMDVLNQLNEGTLTFDTAILNYNDDDGMASYPEGYQMSLESESYVQEFTDAGMALKKVGDISALVATDYGYHIIEYYSDVLSGPIDFETVKAALVEELKETKRNDSWLALADEWLAKHEIVYFYEKIAEEPEETAEPSQDQ